MAGMTFVGLKVKHFYLISMSLSQISHIFRNNFAVISAGSQALALLCSTMEHVEYKWLYLWINHTCWRLSCPQALQIHFLWKMLLFSAQVRTRWILWLIMHHFPGNETFVWINLVVFVQSLETRKYLQIFLSIFLLLLFWPEYGSICLVWTCLWFSMWHSNTKAKPLYYDCCPHIIKHTPGSMPVFL